MNGYQKDFKKIVGLIISEYPPSFYENPDIFKNIKELVDKQTPMKPLEEHGYTKCPICFRIVSEQYNTYCGDCNQAIDWEEENNV